MILLALALAFTFHANAQWTQSGNKIYYSGGNVGIGVSDPQSQLDVQGSTFLGGYTEVDGLKMLHGSTTFWDSVFVVNYNLEVLNGNFIVDGGGILAGQQMVINSSGQWVGPGMDASKITSGTFNVDRIPDLPASQITSGEIIYDRLPITAEEVENWNTAHGWENHALQGYVAGATTVGTNLVQLTNPNAVRYLRINSNNTVSALTQTSFRSSLDIVWSSDTNGITHSGNVGIGAASSSAYRLDVAGDVRIDGSITITAQGDILMGDFGN